MTLRFFLVPLMLSAFLTTTQAAINLPKIFSDHMVIQRDAPINIWGWADPGEKVTVTFNKATGSTVTDKAGNWSVTLKPMSYGGPFELAVKSKSNSITLKNILIGDVWVGSGQSNMEWIIQNTKDAEKEIANANYPTIRHFAVEKATSFTPENDLAGGTWKECTPQNAGDFSAVAYFFGRKLNEDLNVPIGLINSSWGGTNIQTWMSWEVMSQKEEYKQADLGSLSKTLEDQESRLEKYTKALESEPGKAGKWNETTDFSDWKTMKIPTLWEATEVGNADGYMWFGKEFSLTAEQLGQPVTLSLGPIDDIDETYVNGQLVGSMSVWNSDRVYSVPTGVLKPGKNVITIRVYDGAGGGGIYGKAGFLFYEAAGKRTTLVGDWYYKHGVLNTEFGIKDSGPNSFPSLLYNAMIAPIIPFPIKGVIWYQGEANTHEAEKYSQLFPEMIADWRSKWKSDFPFFWVQLANFMESDDQPIPHSDWASLREAQSKTLTVPKTGQAVIIDIGEAEDIHPRNKQDVGYRLALAAEKIAYGQEVVYSGPVFKSMQNAGDKLILSFDQLGSGLWIKDKYGYPKGFAIAGADQKFVWAKAQVDGDKVVVYHPSIKEPVAVRYAWGDNPDDANLYNKEGLPACPFRTDTWDLRK